MKYKTLIFDFDGTLADTLGETRRIFNEIAPQYGLREVPEEELAGLRHFSLNALLRHLNIPKRRVPTLIARGTAIMRNSIATLPLISGIDEVLVDLRKDFDRFGILTSNASANVDLFLRSHGLRDTFDFISSTSKLTGKSRHIRSIRRTFSLGHGEMLYIGDEIRDVRASQKAGIPVAAVSWGFNSHESLAAHSPTHLFDHPKELRSLMDHGPDQAMPTA